jgi:tetratricopeptide (TPR) repeat protein
VARIRSSGQEAYRKLYGELLLTFGAEGYDAAFARLEKAREDEVFRFSQEALEGAGLDLNRMAAFQEAIRRGYEKDEDTSIAIETADGAAATVRLEDVQADGLLVRRGGGTDLVRWAELSVASRAEVGLRERGAMRPESRFDAALWALSKGRIDVAQRHLEAAASLGGDVKPYETSVELVRIARDAKVEDDLRVARVHAQEGRLEEAKTLLDGVVAFAPDHAGVHHALGTVLAGLHRNEAALAELREALRLGDEDPSIHLQIAHLCEAADRLDEAVTAYEAFLKDTSGGPDAEEAARRLGELRGRLAAARADGLREAGEAAMRKRDWETAVDSFRKADELVPDDPKTILNLAISNHRLGRIFDAYVAYRRYLDQRPRGGGPREARKAVTSLEAEYGNAEAALGDLAAGEAAYNAGRYDEAIDKLDQGLAVAPLYADGYYNRGMSWYAKSLISGAGSHARTAIEDFDRLMQIEPDSGRALAGRALCWLLLRRYEAALEDARKAIALLPDQYLSHNTAALACVGLERYKEALDYYDEAIRLAPETASDLPTMYISRARAKWSLRRLDDALADLERASKLKTDPQQSAEIRDLQKRIARDKEESGE